MSGNPLDYLAVAGAGLGYLAYWRTRHRPGPPRSAPPTQPPTGDPDNTAGNTAGNPAEPTGGGRVLSHLPGPVPGPEPDRVLRDLDIVTIRCLDPIHHLGEVPAVVLSPRRLTAGMNTLERQGWAGTAHTNLCPFHNALGLALDTLHVVCETPGCGERTTMRYRSLPTAFGRLRWDGWRNHDDHVMCPYCAGTRRHSRW